MSLVKWGLGFLRKQWRVIWSCAKHYGYLVCAKVGRIPHIVVVGILGADLVRAELVVYVDGWGCAIGNCVFWDGYVCFSCVAGRAG